MAEKNNENSLPKKNLAKAAVIAFGGPLAIPFADKLAEKSLQGLDWLQQNYYGPLFIENLQEQRENENHQNMVVIVDDAQRKKVKLCEGAIGWISKEKKQEVLNLYDTAVEESGITFLPSAQVNTVYWQNPFDRMQYVRVNEFFDFMQENKLAELERIAMMLGAVKCTVSYEEQSKKHEEKKQNQKHKVSYKEGSVAAEESVDVDSDFSNNKEVLLTAEFKKADKPIRPDNIKWFKYDDKVNNLIDIVCMGRKLVKKSIVINSDITSIINEAAAASIDATYMKISGGSKLNFKKRVHEESKKKLVFTVEF